MSDPFDTLYDGNHENPFICGPVRPVVSNETLSMLYYVPTRVRAPFFKRTLRGSRIANVPGYFVEESQPRVVGGDLIEWERVCAEVPQRRRVPEPYVYPWQFITSTSTGTNSNATIDIELAELPVPVTSFVIYDYFHTAEPQKIDLPKAYRVAQLSKWIVALGTKPSPRATELLAEDAQLTRWMGNIWQRTQRYVTARDILKLGRR